MSLDRDQLAKKLEDALGADAVSETAEVRAAHAVDGLAPSVVCAPGSPAQVAEAVRVCASAGAAVVPWGGGTSMRLGNRPRRVDVVLRMQHIDGLVEHDDANLTATMGAGITVAALQTLLAGRSQFLALDPPHPARATVGGTVAANVAGPRRLLYGGVRDQVIGMKMVTADGESIKAGGKVVKNVAGYDMCKLFVGSLGTLGIITEITCRLSPLPETAATVVATGTIEQGTVLIERLQQSMLLPAAVTLLNASAAGAAGLPGGSAAAVAVWVEGFDEVVQRQCDDVAEMASAAGLAPDRLSGGAHRNLWERVRDFGPDGDGIGVRLTVPPGSLGDVVRAIEAQFARHAIRYAAHAGSGEILVAVSGASPGGAWFARLGALARQAGGHAVMIAAPPEAKDGVDVWGPASPALALMRKIKHEFDPQGLLSPGRFVSGL